MRKESKKKLLKCLLTIAGIVLCSILLISILNDNENLTETFYKVNSSKIKGSIRIVVASDLHNMEFGENNEELIKKIVDLKPDIIAITGDMVNKDNVDVEVCLRLCERLREIAPVYYVYGNHEGTLIYEKGSQLPKLLRERGITILENASASININGNLIEIGGTSSSIKLYERYAKDFIEDFQMKEGYKILLCHFPDLFYDILYDVDVDLAFAGHYHGGIIQIPGMGGLYSIEYGFFPRYCSGMFSLKNAKLVVSRGLGESRQIPRINNQPEIVVVDVMGE